MPRLLPRAPEVKKKNEYYYTTTYVLLPSLYTFFFCENGENKIIQRNDTLQPTQPLLIFSETAVVVSRGRAFYCRIVKVVVKPKHTRRIE